MLQLKTQLQKKYSQIKIEVRNLMGTVVSGLRQSLLSLSICFSAFFVGCERPIGQCDDQRCRGATCHDKYYGQHASAGKVGQCTYRRIKHQRGHEYLIISSMVNFSDCLGVTINVAFLPSMGTDEFVQC